ncbi:MAG TPA: PQQ-binding-like beta-propeller repeat protein [Verrucomicrobiae bacterium]|nr:PQQ-binding-like beta-propeller repeat protein [Verrucomicrobiae bacterium]
MPGSCNESARRYVARLFQILFISAFTGSALAAGSDWPEFRGPTEDGHVPATGNGSQAGIPLNWSETNNVVWKTAIPDRGWSTPVVMNGQVWLTTASVDGHDFFAICVDAESGKIKFNEKLFHCDHPEPLGNNVNAYATPSPVIEPGRVYVHFGSYGTACLDTETGKVIWQRDDLRCRHYRGPSSSPVLFRDLLILTFDGADLQYLAALDKKTGKTVWKTDRSAEWNDADVPGQVARDGDLRKAHSTPLIVQFEGQTQLLSTGAKAAYAYDPVTGKELWKVHFPAWSAAPRPVYENGTGFFVTGHGQTELLAVRLGGQGDVTDSHVSWKFDSVVPRTASPILIDGLLYMVSDDGAVTCLEENTGKQVWRSRIGGTYAASPIYADGRIYFFSQQGKTTVVKPGRSFEALATNSLSTGFMASPAVSGHALFLRTKTDLYRIE